MKFEKTKLEGVWLVALEPRGDDRGFLARTYCDREFAEHGLNTHWPQCNLTRTARRGMVRGMHFQADPHPEVKLLRCARGAIYDVVVDIRKASPTYGEWAAFELTADSNLSLYIGAGFAHGLQCLEDDSDVFYMMGDSYHPELARGLRHDDPAVGIVWKLPYPIVSARDAALPLLTDLA